MNLYIQTENGNPINHPALMDNLISAFGAIPDNWKPFIRVQRPISSVYQVLVNKEPTYEFNKATGYWMDTWVLRDMTTDEIATKQQAEKDRWLALPNRENFSAWTFNEATCRYEPPIPRPEGDFKWDGATNSWIALPLPITV